MTFSCNQCLSECLSQCVTPCCQLAAGSRWVVTTFDLTASRKLYFYQLLVASSKDLLLLWEIFLFFLNTVYYFSLSLWRFSVQQENLPITMHHSSLFPYTFFAFVAANNCIKATRTWAWPAPEKWFLHMDIWKRGTKIDICVSKLKQGKFILAPRFPEKIRAWKTRCGKRTEVDLPSKDSTRSPDLCTLPNRVFRSFLVCSFITHVYPERFLLCQTRSYNFKSCLQCSLFLHNNDDFDN